MALTMNTPRDYQVADREDYPVAATSQIFEGSAVGENASGYARALVAADKFLGFAVFEADTVQASPAIILTVTVKSNGSTPVRSHWLNRRICSDPSALIGYTSRRKTLVSCGGLGENWS